MKRLIETLKQLGIEIPKDKEADAKKILSEQYKAVEEHNKTVSKLEEDRDDWKERAEKAEKTLKGFEGVDLQTIQTELGEWRKKAEETEKEMNRRLEERDFKDALKTELESIQFSSEAAKKAVMAEIVEAGLKVKNGKILGLSDLLDQIKTNDASAFVDQDKKNLEDNKPKFTDRQNNNSSVSTKTKEEIMAIKDPTERRKAIKENFSVFQKEE